MAVVVVVVVVMVVMLVVLALALVRVIAPLSSSSVCVGQLANVGVVVVSCRSGWMGGVLTSVPSTPSLLVLG